MPIQETETQPERPTPKTVYNLVSIVGAAIAIFGTVGEVFFFAMELMSSQTPAYQGLVYVLLLVLIVVGLGTFFWGYRREKKRRQSGLGPGISAKFIAENTLLIFLFGIGLIAALTIVVGMGSYKVYHMTESNEFCGQTCHSVMNPEYVTYHSSSHARVRCVECHIGSGAGWYVKSKLSGLRQVIAVAANTYPRPIETPIHNLRPARETCEQCHWPKRYIGYKEVIRSYFLSDEKNTPLKLRMLMKIGGEKTGFMKGSGIHYHMLLAAKVEYISRSEKRQDIPWVRILRDDGSVTVYNHQEKPLSEAEMKELPVRTMDCMDCHNRPAHKFLTPMEAVNRALEENAISPEIPMIKLQAVKALDADYKTTEEALTGIASSLRTYYQKNYPEVLEQDRWQNTVKEVQRVYQKNIFPEMNAKWSAYPDNIGHRDWPGCFRCHNDQMKSAEGDTIFTTCNKCHLLLAQGQEVDQVNVDFSEGLTYVHPGEDEESMDKYTDCSDCHTGGAETYN
ncbi:NapC/NirT family cytochrome c [Deltaproteobacteria bacterium TL4]